MKTGLVVCGAVTTVIDIILLAVGAGVLPGTFDSMVKSGIKNNAQFTPKDTTSAVISEEDTTSTGTTNFYVYNVVNAKAVLDGAVPIMQQIKIVGKKTSVAYNHKFDAANDWYGQRSFTYYDSETGREMDDIKVITINPVYFGAAIGEGSEIGLQSQVRRLQFSWPPLTRTFCPARPSSTA